MSKTKDRFISTQEIKKENEKLKLKKKKKNQQRIRDLMAFTPKQMQAKYESYGLEWHMRDFYIAYSAAIAVSVLFCYVFSFKAPYIIATFFMGLFFAPVILTSQKKSQYESNRFNDVNIYMQQFSHGMVKHARIRAAFLNALQTFPSGEMHDIIGEAVEILDNADSVREGELAAFSHMEKKYGNHQMSTLHDFAVKIEDRGGDYSYEISLLDRLRGRWEERVTEFQKDLSATTFFCVFEYALIIMICGFIQAKMPEQMNITHMTATQVAETVAILVMYLFFLSLQKKKCQNWIQMDEPMTEKEAEELQDYIENFNPGEKRRKNMKLAVLWAFGSIAFIFGTKNFAFAVFAALFEIAILNSHYIIYEMTKYTLRTEMRKTFPKWLFDICLLMQKENVANAITKSIPKAPPVLRRELEKLNEELMERPSSVELLVNFLKGYNIPGAKKTMSILAALQKGSVTNDRLQMENLVEENMKMLDKEDKIAADFKAATLARYYYYPMLPAAGLMAVYFFGIIMKVLMEIAAVLGV